MALFSERYGYTKPSDVIIREKMTPEIENAICSCFYDLRINNSSFYETAELYVWRYFYNNDVNEFNFNDELPDFFGKYLHRSIIPFIKDKTVPWFEKLDLIEFIVKYYAENKIKGYLKSFIDRINAEFARLCFAYRIVENKIVEITSEEEIVAIETALKCGNSIKTHLSNALGLLAIKPEGDYRNSIKESISAVEAFTREITGEKVLNLGKLEEAGITLPSTLRNAFNNLYGYTNDKSTGIRHALMDDTNAPSAEEAIFMLVSCSAFINYLEKKKSN